MKFKALSSNYNNLFVSENQAAAAAPPRPRQGEHRCHRFQKSAKRGKTMLGNFGSFQQFRRKTVHSCIRSQSKLSSSKTLQLPITNSSESVGGISLMSFSCIAFYNQASMMKIWLKGFSAVGKDRYWEYG